MLTTNHERPPICVLSPLVIDAMDLAFPGATAIAAESLPTTQDVVTNLTMRGAKPGTWCCALTQTAGRGRADRTWIASPGSALLFSIALEVPTSVVEGIPFAAAIAVAETIEHVAGVRPRLKWPNDVLWDGKKLAGILPDITFSGAQCTVTLGIGLNVDNPPFPPDIPGVSCAAFMRTPPEIDSLLAHLLLDLSKVMDSLITHGSIEMIHRWKADAVGIGSPVHVSHALQADIDGIALDVDTHGALVVSTTSGTLHVIAGDIHIGLSHPRSSRA